MLRDNGSAAVPGCHEQSSPDGTRQSGGRPTTRNRAEIPEQYQWNLADIYPDWKTWERELARFKELVSRFPRFKGTLADGAERLVEIHRAGDELGILSGQLYQYPSLMSCEDTRDNEVLARLEQSRIAISEYVKATAWYRPELLAISEETVQRWLDETEDLAEYRFPIEETFRRQRHVLDEAGEQLLAFASRFNNTPDHTYTMLADADVEYPTLTLSTGEQLVASYANMLNVIHTNRNQADREAIFRAHSGVYKRNINTYAAIYDSLLQRDWFLTQARRYGSCLEMALDIDNIPVAVVEGLITTAKGNAGPLQRYHQLRRRVLGLERYRYFDAYLPLVEGEWTVPYDSAQELVVNSVAVFGSEYQRTVDSAFTKRWIDVYENDGKRSGAFSSGSYGLHPYMMLNYSDTLNDLFTVAHEVGHTLHSVLSNEHQPFCTSTHTIFVAEVASTTNEDLLRDELLKREHDPRRRITLLQHAIDDIAGSFYRQAMFADFELQAHTAVEQGRPITASSMKQLYLQILRDFFGDSLDDQDWYGTTWAQIPHFFGSPFYVYQYCTAKAAATLVHEHITVGDPEQRAVAVERYLTLLKSGGDDHPVEQLKKAGVDFTTTEPIEALVRVMDRLVDQLENELRELGLLRARQ